MRKRFWTQPVLGAALLTVALALSGCAYFNTFYTAKKSFNEAEGLYETPDARATGRQIQLYDAALRGATKIVVNYSNSKWVDDAVLMMGRSLTAKSDYAEARLKFEELAVNFPESDLLDQGLYYNAESYRLDRRFDEALDLYDSLFVMYPRSKMHRRADLQKGKIFVQRLKYRVGIGYLYPIARKGGDLELDARINLAEAYFELEAYDSAATNYAWVAKRSSLDQIKNDMLLKQGECYEAMGEYYKAKRLYADWGDDARVIGHRDQAKIRLGYVQAQSGEIDRGMDTLERIIAERRRSPSAAEAMFQIGFIQEVLLDDFDGARVTYARVSEESRGSPFAQQASQRLQNLDKIEELRASVAADSTGEDAAAGAAFSVAEHYLFQANNSRRAFEEYVKVEQDYPGTTFAPKAAFAAAWILERKLDQPEQADSAWKAVVDAYPETPFGEAASAFMRGREDSLRAAGPLEPTLVSFPISPGSAAYVKPQGDLNLARGRGAAPRTVVAAAVIDSVARADSLRMIADRGRELGVVEGPDSLAVPADSVGTVVDTTSAEEAAPADTAAAEETAEPDTIQTPQEEPTPADTSGTPSSQNPADTSDSLQSFSPLNAVRREDS